VASDLERIAQGLIDYLDENPRLAADLRNAAGQCLELASLVGELAALLPAAGAAAQYLDSAARACDEAGQLAFHAYGVGRAWATSAVGGGGTTTDSSKRNPATSVGRDGVSTDADRVENDDAIEELELVTDLDTAGDRIEGSEVEQIDAAGDLAELGELDAVGDLADDLAAVDEVDLELRPEGGGGEIDLSPERFSLDTVLDEGTTARDVLKRYDPAKANLPAMTADEAVEYIAANKDEHPWLAPAADCEPEVQLVYATLDTGLGHAHHRHDGMGDDELYERRVAYLEDPAQTDPAKRAKSEDAFKPGTIHYCAEESTRISDPSAFATAIARLLEHEDVRKALSMPWDEDTKPYAANVPITEILGSDGYRHCSGFRLAGEWPASKQARKVWVTAGADGHDRAAMPQPSGVRISTFESGVLRVIFRSDPASRSYQIGTMFAIPEKSEGS